MELGELRSAEAIPYLRRYLQSDAQKHWRLAASAIGKIAAVDPEGARPATPELLKVIRESDGQPRQYALKALTRLGPPASFAATLREIAATDPKSYNRQAAENALTRLAKIDRGGEELERMTESDKPRERARALLRQAAGSDATFHPGQLEAIEALLESRRVLVVQRTGWGKSMVYFLTTALLRQRGAGPTIIISPLLALMRNQVAAAAKVGLNAATYNSQNMREWRTIERQLRESELDVLLISPERLGNDDFVDEHLLQVAREPGLFVVDEAHCISDWGHDFRPYYRKIARILERLPPNVPLLGTTATATKSVTRDVREQLGQKLEVQRGELVRSSLHLHVEHLPTQEARLSWLAEAIKVIEGSGILYCKTKEETRRVAEWLRLCGIDAQAYNADTPDREALEQALLGDKLRALVATTALGMGFDKPDLAFVIHFRPAQSVIHYYQQVGRAGRAIESAVGITLVGDPKDREQAEYFIKNAFPREANIEKVLDALENADDGGLTEAQLSRAADLAKNDTNDILKFLSVERRSPVVRQGERWHRTPNPFVPDRERMKRITDQRWSELDEIERYASSKECLMQFLARALDSPTEKACGRCSVCLGRPVLQVKVPAKLTARAKAFCRVQHVAIEPRTRSPNDEIPLNRRNQPGRALCRWGDDFWGAVVREGKAAKRFDDRLVAEAVTLIRERWKPRPFPEWVACVPSRSAPVRDFAHRLAARLGLAFVDCVRKIRTTAKQKDIQSPELQFSNVAGAFRVNDPGPDITGPVLLVDDVVDSRWTFTVVGYHLRKEVRCLVYPLALADTSRA
jgi:ATP-dependent DNA helicase RecQ